MKINSTPAPSQARRNAQLFGWGFVVGLAALAVPLRIFEIAGGAA